MAMRKLVWILSIVSLIALLPSKSSYAFHQNLLPEDAQIVISQQIVFGEILAAYALLALDKPPDLVACAQEMLRMKPNEKSCRDKYSAWISYQEYQEIVAPEIGGRFGGVGLEVTEQEGKVVVVSPIDDTPAQRAGIRSGDVIVKVDGVAVANLRDAVKRMRGQPGVEVEITVARGERELSFRVMRKVIAIRAVSSKTLDVPGGKVGYIRVKTFSEVMPNEFRNHMIAFRQEGINKVILDYRYNPGGLLTSAIENLYDFANAGDTIVVMREREHTTVFDTETAKYRAGFTREPGEFRDMRIVVLVNKGSASASEMFAGTMKDWGYPVVGSTTFGKGVGQTFLPLSDKSILDLTTFEFLVGNGRVKVNEAGVQPTHPVNSPESSAAEVLREDKQLEKAIEILTK